MAVSVKEMIDQIRQGERSLRKNESASVPIVVEQARRIRQLRTKTRRNWESTLKKAGIHERVGRRYLKIGEKWDTPERSPDPALMGKLPGDLHKLEALCELPLDQLKELANQDDLFKKERNELIGAVRVLLGKEAPKSQTRPLDATLKKFDSFVDSIENSVAKLDATSKEEFAAEFETLLETLRGTVEDALKKPADMSDFGDSGEDAEDEKEEADEDDVYDDVGDDGDDEKPDDADETDDGGDGGREPLVVVPPAKKEGSAATAPATRGHRPVGGRSPKPQRV